MSASKPIKYTGRSKTPNGMRLKTVRKQMIALRKGKSKALQKRAKRAIKTERVVSPRHRADLIQPDQPFAILQMLGDYLSTAIYQFDYDPTTFTLQVQFWKIRVRNKRVVSRKPGSIYIYFRVPPQVHEALIKASSKGRYFYYNIRSRYQFKRLS